jgi:hypothetical protein
MFRAVLVMNIDSYTLWKMSSATVEVEMLHCSKLQIENDSVEWGRHGLKY